MRVLFLLIFLGSFLLQAQDVTGVWKGTLSQDPDRSYYFEISVDNIDFNGYLSGVTYVKEISSGNDGTISFTGSFKNNQFKFREKEIVKEVKRNNGGYYSSNSWFWCIKNGTLDFSQKEGSYYLKGSWNAEGGCSGGTLEVSKDIPEGEQKDCADIESAEMMLGAWKGKFHQHACNVFNTYPMIVLIDKFDGMKFSGQFIWTNMKYASDSRSTLEGEIKNGEVYFYEIDLISGGGLILDGTYKSKFVNCEQLNGYWFLEKPDDICKDPQVLKNGGDYDLDHYIIPTIYFDQKTSTLREKSKEDLNEFVKFMQDFPSMNFEMSGHTDNSGSNALNLILSKKRAQIVIDYLVSKGISAFRFSYTFHAQSEPAELNDSNEHMQLNRRTEIKLLPGK
jgi:OmpA family